MLISEMLDEGPKKAATCDFCGALHFTSANRSAVVVCLDCAKAIHERRSEQADGEYTWDNFKEHEARQERLTKRWMGSKK